MNINGDYGYAIMETVEFHLRKCKPLKEYLPPESEEDPVFLSFVDTGYVLNFSFVCGYGTFSTFGKDKDIFYEECLCSLIHHYKSQHLQEYGNKSVPEESHSACGMLNRPIN